MRIDNSHANKLLKAFREGEKTKEFMDAISGVEDYRLDNLSRQGCIRGMFAKELIADQFLLELEEIVSIFWHGVFENVDKARLWGEKTEINPHIKNACEVRATKNNPIHYIRTQASYAVRNYITSLYRKNLQQSCPSCGNTTSIKINKKCNKCSTIMSTTYKFIDINDDIDQFSQMSSYRYIEDNDMEIEISFILNDFGAKVLGYNTRAYQVLKILTDPKESVKMCDACNLCDAKTFDIDSCTNYNANIGNFLGVNKTMIANKMRRIRKALPEFLFSEGTVEANYILDLISSKYKSFLPVVN